MFNLFIQSSFTSDQKNYEPCVNKETDTIKDIGNTLIRKQHSR